MSLARISVNNPVTVNTIMFTIIVLGLYCLWRLPQEFMPDVSLNMALLVTVYPGTSPEDVEKLITIPLEDEIKDVKNIDFIMSNSSEGQSTVFIRFEEMSDDEFNIVLQNLRSAVDGVDDLPEDAEEPEILEIETAEMTPTIQATITGDLSPEALIELGNEFKDRLLEIDHIGKLEVTGVRDREIWVKVDPDRMYGHGLSIEQIAHALKATNFNMPGGRLEVGDSEFLIRSVGEYESVSAIRDVIVRSDPGGTHTTIRRIATVEDTHERPRDLSFFNRKPGVTFNISKKKEGHTIAMVDQIKEIARTFEKNRLPEGARVLITNDSSIQIRDAIGKLTTNALMGTVFVVVLLCLFVGWRNALFAGIGVPVSLMCTFVFIDITGGSLNTSSLFGLMMVIGIIVDDAIVIIENCYRYLNMGLSPREAAVAGTEEVMSPVFAACLTTIAAFSPLMLMPDIIGKFLRVVPVVVCLALVASLLEAFCILPSHIADWSRPERLNRKRESIIGRAKTIYTGHLVFALKRRYVFVGAVAALFAGCIGLLGFGIIQKDMFKMEEISQFYINVHMPEGTSIEKTLDTLRDVENTVLSAVKPEELSAYVTNAGMMITQDEWVMSTSVGHVMVDLVESDKRERSIDDIIRTCRSRLDSVAGPLSVGFRKIRGGPPISPDVEVKVVGKYLPEIRQAAEAVRGRLENIPGVYDIKDDLDFGKKELKIYIDEDKAALYGLDFSRIANSIRNAYDGKVATVFREGDEEIDIVVKFDPAFVKEIEDIENIKIPTPRGDFVPFRNLGSLKLEPGFTKIRHFKRERAVTVSAYVDEKVNNIVTVNQLLKKQAGRIMKAFPQCRLRFEGAFREMREAFSSLWQLFVFGLFFIYIILGAQFKSYAQPFIILLTIPFAFIGAVAALIFSNSPFSIIVLYGFVGLAGIAVNDAIVMISFINNARARGAGRWRSIIEAGRLRLRPIILTSVTTMFGVMPMALGLGGKSEIWAPMANTLFWGLGFATFLTLFILPGVYTVIVDDLPFFWRQLKQLPGRSAAESGSAGQRSV